MDSASRRENASPDKRREDLALRPLPVQATDLLAQVNAPPRLMAHLLLVHEVAAQLLDALHTQWPSIVGNPEAVLFGAAVHDIGKMRYPEELSGPGHEHEAAGVSMLIQAGISQPLARFAQTHAQWDTLPDIQLEDLIVALADTCWKGKRNPALEDRLIAMLAECSGEERLQVFINLDLILEGVAKDADARLAWQAQFAVHNDA